MFETAFYLGRGKREIMLKISQNWEEKGRKKKK